MERGKRCAGTPIRLPLLLRTGGRVGQSGRGADRGKGRASYPFPRWQNTSEIDLARRFGLKDKADSTAGFRIWGDRIAAELSTSEVIPTSLIESSRIYKQTRYWVFKSLCAMLLARAGSVQVRKEFALYPLLYHCSPVPGSR